jgi:hypothetical protein
MPIEIRELHIKVDIAEAPGAGAGQPAGAPAPAGGGAAQDAIVAECVEQVLRILQNRKER